MTGTTPLETEFDGIHVTTADNAPGEWDDLVERSTMGTVFHRRDFLETVTAHSRSSLQLLVGFKGNEAVGLFPIFDLRRGPITSVFSPPPGMGLSQLGPVMVNLDGLKRRRAFKRVKRFMGAALDWIERDCNPSLIHVRTSPGFTDHRPLQWNGFDVTPRHTYVIELSPGREDVISSFSADARRNIRTTPDSAVAIQESVEGIDRIIEHLDRRHAEQDLEFPVGTSFVRDLVTALDDDALRAYRCTVDGQYVSGMIVLADGDTVYRWQGGARPARDVGLPVNDLLDWRVMTDAMDRGQKRYDMLGANTDGGVSEYKSKFGPELVTFASAERGTRMMRFASGLYQRFR